MNKQGKTPLEVAATDEVRAAFAAASSTTPSATAAAPQEADTAPAAVPTTAEDAEKVNETTNTTAARSDGSRDGRGRGSRQHDSTVRTTKEEEKECKQEARWFHCLAKLTQHLT